MEGVKIVDPTPLYQWDINQKLTVEGEALYIDYDFPDEPIRVAIENRICAIPDEWLQTSGRKILWLCSEGNTREAVYLSIRPRPMPPDYVYTPTQRITFESLVASVEAAVESSTAATTAANTAAAAATAATAAANQAEAARAAAETARVTAEANRAAAETSRANAETARASAETARATAETERANAETARATAETARANAESERAEKWGQVSAQATTLPAGSSATAAVSQDNTGTHYIFGIPKGEKGDKGNVNFATFAINAITGILSMTTDEEYSGANFSINNNGYMEVII